MCLRDCFDVVFGQCVVCVSVCCCGKVLYVVSVVCCVVVWLLAFVGCCELCVVRCLRLFLLSLAPSLSCLSVVVLCVCVCLFDCLFIVDDCFVSACPLLSRCVCLFVTCV